MGAVPPWFWTAASWAFVAAAAYLLLSQRPLARKRTRRTCPRCDYDMSATASRTCSECGYVAPSERHLFTKPLARLRIAVALALSVLAWAAPHVPRIIERGSVALIPGWLLAAIAPTNGSEADLAEAGLASPQKGLMTYATVVLYRPQRSLTRPHSPLFVETLRRLRDGELGDAAAASYLRRFLVPEITSPIPDDIGSPYHTTKCDVPAEWPSDKQFNSNIADWLGPGTIELWAQVVYIPGQRPQKYTMATVGAQQYRIQASDVQMHVSKPAATFMAATTTPTLDEEVGTVLFTHLAVSPSNISLVVNGPPAYRIDDRAPAYRAEGRFPAYGACTTRILLNGEELGRCRSDWVGDFAQSTAIVWISGGEQRARASLDQLQIEFTGNAQQAVENYTANWHYPPIAWSGTITIKPSIVLEH